MSKNKKSKNDNIGFSAIKSEISQDLRPMSEKIYMSVKLHEVIKREIGNRTQAQIAREAGIAPSLLNDWVSARRNPSGKNFVELRKLATYFGR